VPQAIAVGEQELLPAQHLKKKPNTSQPTILPPQQESLQQYSPLSPISLTMPPWEERDASLARENF